MLTKTFGATITGLSIDGRHVRAEVSDEHEVCAAAGLTLVSKVVEFVYAYFSQEYGPVKCDTSLLFINFLPRVGAGLRNHTANSSAPMVPGWRERAWS